MAQPRVAIFFVGRITGWQAVRSILKKFQETYNATFFVSLNTDTFTESDILFCKYFGLGQDQIRAEITPMPEKFSIFMNMYSQYYHNDKCFQLIESYCTKYDTTFDIVVKSRADLNSTGPLHLEWPIHENRIYCPTHDAYQVKDEINYGDFKTMKLYSLLVDTLEHHYNTGGLWYGAARHPMLPELVLFQYICQLNQLYNTNIIYIDYKFSIHDAKNDPGFFNRERSKVAVLFPGRIHAWKFCKDHLLELKIQQNATFFCSLNMSELDSESREFCEFFSIGPDQLNIQETVCPEKYRKIYNGYSQAFHVQKAFDKVEYYSGQTGIKFDCIIKYRADLYSQSLPDFNQDLTKNVFFLTSAWGGINEIIYYGNFVSMKAVSRFCENTDFLQENGYFSVDFLQKINLQRHPCMGECLNNEEYFGIYVMLLQIQGLIQISYFNFFYISHPARRIDFWTDDYQKKLITLFTSYKNYIETRDTRYFIDNYNSELTQLFQAIENDTNKELLHLAICGISWPSP
jgi:hypothetical protein